MDQNLHSKQTFKQNSRIISTDESLKQFIQNQIYIKPNLLVQDLNSGHVCLIDSNFVILQIKATFYDSSGCLKAIGLS